MLDEVRASLFPSSDAPQRKKIRSASPSQPRSVGPPSSDSAPPTSATTTPSQPTPPQPLTEGAPHVGQRGGGAGGGGGQECPSGTSSQRATVATATGADSQEHVPVQHHEASSNVESYDFTVSGVQPAVFGGCGRGGGVGGCGRVVRCAHNSL